MTALLSFVVTLLSVKFLAKSPSSLGSLGDNVKLLSCCHHTLVRKVGMLTKRGRGCKVTTMTTSIKYIYINTYIIYIYPLFSSLREVTTK